MLGGDLTSTCVELGSISAQLCTCPWKCGFTSLVKRLLSTYPRQAPHQARRVPADRQGCHFCCVDWHGTLMPNQILVAVRSGGRRRGDMLELRAKGWRVMEQREQREHRDGGGTGR